MYSIQNFKTKKQLKAAILAHQTDPDNNPPVKCFQPGPFGPEVADGKHCCEGPHYPEPHRWYATVTVRSGCITDAR